MHNHCTSGCASEFSPFVSIIIPFEIHGPILNIFDDYFTDEMIDKRKKILNDLGYMNEQNVKKLLKMLQINE